MQTSIVPNGIVTKRTVVSSTVLLAENFIRLGMVAAVSFWIARTLGPTKFGILNYASAVIMVFLSISTLGMETPVILRLTKNCDPSAILGSAIALRAGVGVVCALAACGAVFLMRSGEHLSLVVAAIASLSIPLSASVLVDCWFKERNDPIAPAIARIVATTVSCASKAFCIGLGFGVVALAWTVALESAVMGVALTYAYFKAVKGGLPGSLKVDRHMLWSLLLESRPYVISIAAIAAYMKVDVIMLGLLSTDRETGVYSLCQKLSEVLYILPVVVVDVLYPSLARSHEPMGQGAATASQTFFDLTIAVAILGTVAAIVVTTWLVPRLFGEQYHRTVDIFHIHAWSCIGIAMAHARYKWMAASGLQRYAPAVTLVGLVLAIGLNAVLIPSLGGLGSAIATVIAYACSGYLASFAIPSLRPVASVQTRALWPWLRLYRLARARGGHAV